MPSMSPSSGHTAFTHSTLSELLEVLNVLPRTRPVIVGWRPYPFQPQHLSTEPLAIGPGIHFHSQSLIYTFSPRTPGW
jgi:hypothetical protein